MENYKIKNIKNDVLKYLYYWKYLNSNCEELLILRSQEVIEDIYNNIRELHIFTDKKLPGKVYFPRFGEIKK